MWLFEGWIYLKMLFLLDLFFLVNYKYLQNWIGYSAAYVLIVLPISSSSNGTSPSKSKVEAKVIDSCPNSACVITNKKKTYVLIVR